MSEHTSTAGRGGAAPAVTRLVFRFSRPRRLLCAILAAFGALEVIDAFITLAGFGDVAVSESLLVIGVGAGQCALFVWLYLGHVTVTPEGIDSQALRHRFFPAAEINDVQVRVVPTATYISTYAPYVIRKDGSRARLAPMERIFNLDRVTAETALIHNVLGLDDAP